MRVKVTAMHLAFIDIASAYAAGRPDQGEPFGGTKLGCLLSGPRIGEGRVACTFSIKSVNQKQSMESAPCRSRL